MKKLLIIMTTLFSLGCSGELDGKLVKDVEGNVYKLDVRVGKLYYLEPIDIDECKDIIKFNNTTN